MRIAVLMSAAGSRLGGHETIARGFALGLGRLGHEVTLVTGVGPGARLLDEVKTAPYETVLAPTLGQSSAPARLIARMRRVHPSVVESRIFWRSAMITPGTRRALEQSQVISAHFEPEAVSASNELQVPVVYYYAGAMDPRRLARGRFRRVVAISNAVAINHASLKVQGIPRIDGIVLPGVPEDSIAPGPAPGVSATQPEAIFTGRLDNIREKGALRLVHWWAEISNDMPGGRLTIIGGGRELPALRQEVAARGITSITLTGPLPHSEVYSRLRQASLYIFPSQSETFGVAPLEALAAGLPVLASDLPALRESLGSAALLLPADAEAAWRDAIIRLLRNPVERLAMAEKGPERAREITWGRQSEAYEAHLLAAAGDSASSGAGVEPRKATKV